MYLRVRLIMTGIEDEMFSFCRSCFSVHVVYITLARISVPRSSIHRLRVWQEPAVLALGVGEVVWTILSFPFSPSPEDGSIKTEILPQRTGKPKTTNQHSTVGISVHLGLRMCIFCLIFFM